MLAAQRLRVATRAAVRSSLSLDPVLMVAERVARLVGRRWPEAYIGRALRFHVVDMLGQRVDTETRVAQLPGGAGLLVTLRDYALRELYFKGSRTTRRGWLWEPETTRFVFRWLRPGDTFVDIGAHVGYYTAIAGSIVGRSGRVHAFEPNPAVAALLQKTVDLNRYGDRTEINAVAVTSTGAPIEIYRPTDPGATMATTTVPHAWQSVLPGLQVSSVTLDGYVTTRRIKAIRLVKIDVEGAELDVLSGASHTLQAVRPQALICEFCPALLADPSLAWQRLIAQTIPLGYRPFFLESDGTLTASDGRMPSWRLGNICLVLPQQ
jgi:FkbM family methyltransferase